jgi:O-methyltransferase
MLGPARLANLRRLVEATLQDAIPGDYIETGVWRGGACILIRAVLAAHGVADRRVFVADSFEGLPRPNAETYPADRRDKLFRFAELAISEEEVRSNFAAYGLLDAQVVFLKGFFRDTLPRLTDERFAVIRLDGDMYESTTDALVNLYDRLAPGGYAIVDDYGSLGHCRKAVHDFLDARRLSPKIEPVDEGCVWWRKETA